MNTSVVGWSGDWSWLMAEFARAPERHMADYCIKRRWGDQAFVRDRLTERGIEPEFWPADQVVSYKAGVLKGADTSNARIICYHGLPRPWELG